MNALRIVNVLKRNNFSSEDAWEFVEALQSEDRMKIETMEDAILEGKALHKLYPERGSEEFQIKAAVAFWIWQTLRNVQREPAYKTDLEEQLLEFMKRVTR